MRHSSDGTALWNKLADVQTILEEEARDLGARPSEWHLPAE
jgi:hypothetical protein